MEKRIGIVVTQPSIISFPIEDALVKIYKLRWCLPSPKPKSMGVEVSVPRDFIRAMARRSNLSYGEFVERCQVVVYYTGGDTLLYKFELNGQK